jgi:uncharacterized membrane protein
VLVAGRYDDRLDVLADLERVRDAYLDLHLDADVAIVATGRDEDGELTVLRKYEEQRSRSQVVHGLEAGALAGAAIALLPTVGIGALVVGALGGSATGAAARHLSRSMSDDDLLAVEETMTAGEYALLVVGPTALQDKLRSILPASPTHRHHLLHERALRAAKEGDPAG